MNRLINWIQKWLFLVGISLADRFGKDVPVASLPDLRSEENYGYVESLRTAQLRNAWVARRATREEILAAADHKRAMALIRDAGGC